MTQVERAQRAAAAAYENLQAAAANWRKMGTEPTRIMAATLEQVTEHYVMCAEIGEEYRVNLDPEKVKFGTSREELVAMADRKAAKNRRSRGYKALRSKYGEETAKQIISKKR